MGGSVGVAEVEGEAELQCTDIHVAHSTDIPPKNVVQKHWCKQA
jgi:hypothetical protein